MKLKTSCFNKTAFRKNLTRFAPVWGLYTICLMMGLFLMLNSSLDYWFLANVAECIQVMAVVNLGYALVCTQLLFGDLYNARMCNMLHALPIRREGWFLTHVVSGLAFSFGPTLVMTLAALAMTPFSNMVNGWQIPLYWLLGANLEFVFFFGVAVLCALCVGSRFAQAVLYAIVNFAAVLVYFLVDTLYAPMFYGIHTSEEPFLWLTPVVKMVDTKYIDCEQIETFLGYTPEGYEHFSYHGEFTVTGHWWYLFLCAAIGIGLMGIALMLYRKRRLETAGDFIAIRPLEPVFLVVYTLMVGTCMDFFISQMFGYGEGLLFLFAGLFIGWFTGKMLLERQVKVFTKRNWLHCFALVGAFILSLGIAYLDPLGFETWVPETDQVVGVGVGTGHGTYHQSHITLTEAQDIEKILAIHEEALEKRIDETAWEIVVSTEPTQAVECPAESTTEEIIYKEQLAITLTYQLKNGTTKTRYYYVYAEDPAGQTLEAWFSTPGSVFGLPEEELTDAFLDELVKEANVGCYGPLEELEELVEQLSRTEKRELLNAMIADCREGTMAQDYTFHRGVYDVMYIYFDNLLSENGRYYGREITIHVDNRNVMQWLKGKGVDVIALLKEEYGEEYGKY